MIKYRWWILLAVVVVAGVSWWLIQSAGSGKITFRARELESGRLVASVSATGTVEPVVQVEVGSQVSGTISQLHADYNDEVKKGDLLAQLEPSLFRTSVIQAEANLEKAKAALREAQRAYHRAQGLRERDVVAEIDLEVAESSFEQRKAELRQAEASLETARVNLGHTSIRSPISGVVISRKVDVGQTVAASLQAPVLFVLAEDLQRMNVESKIDEADIGQIRDDLQVFFTVDAYPDERFQGVVSQVRLEPIIEDNVVTYATVIKVENADRKLRPGMTANVTIIVARKQDVLKVPNAALRFRPPGEKAGPRRGMTGGGGNDGGTARAATQAQAGAGAGRQGGPPGESGATTGGPEETRSRSRVNQRRIFILDAAGQPKPVMVGTGITDGAFTEITSGELNAGDRVIVGIDTGKNGDDLAPPPGFGRRR